jgi:excisionase family DNA binding protein
MLTVAEAARRFRVSRATVYKLVGEGRLAHVRIGNQIRFLPGAIGRGHRQGWRGKGRPE